MGCFSSRFDKRCSAYTSDLNTVGLAFIGGDKDHPYDLFPVDRVSWANDTTKEIADSCPVEGMAATNEELTTAAYKKCLAALQAEHDALSKKYGSCADPKKPLVRNRYPCDEAIKQLADAIAFLKDKSGIVIEEAKAEEPAMMMEGEMMMGEEEKKDGEEMMEGGDEGEMMGDAMMMEGDMMAAAMEKINPHKYDGDDYDYSGWAKVPAAMLRCMIVCPIAGDIIKAEALQWEMNHEKAKADKCAFVGLCGMLGHSLSKEQAGDAEFFLSGRITPNDQAALDDICKGETPLKAIHFPFATMGWNSQEEALQALALERDIGIKGDYHEVVFKVTGAKSMKFVGCRQVAHKINGAINAAPADAVDGVTTYEVTAVPLETQTVEAWKAEVAARAAAAANPPKAEEMMMGAEGEMMMEGEDKKDEGEMMMEM
jgi:hypothetical protein